MRSREAECGSASESYQGELVVSYQLSVISQRSARRSRDREIAPTVSSRFHQQEKESRSGDRSYSQRAAGSSQQSGIRCFCLGVSSRLQCLIFCRCAGVQTCKVASVQVRDSFFLKLLSGLTQFLSIACALKRDRIKNADVSCGTQKSNLLHRPAP